MKKNDHGQTSAFSSKTSRFKPVILAHRGSALPWLVESGAYPPDRALPGSPRQCSLPRACRHPPEGHQIGPRKRRAPGNTILSQPYRRRVSTDRLDREGTQLAASLEDEPGPTPAGKTVQRFKEYTTVESRRCPINFGCRTRCSANHGPPKKVRSGRSVLFPPKCTVVQPHLVLIARQYQQY